MNSPMQSNHFSQSQWVTFGDRREQAKRAMFSQKWDTVFFSASDTGRLAGNGPFLADTSCPEGKLVVNTAISRAKKYLRFFFDRQFWKGRAVPSLLTEVAQWNSRVQNVSPD